MFAVIGSGFGLYGYLPALVDGCGQTIVLPERYRFRYQARPELARYSSALRWAPDEDAALDRADGAALVLRPEDQEAWLGRCLARAGLGYLLLEKPLARTPKLAQLALDALIRSGRAFRIGYLFGLSEWGRQLLGVLGAGEYSGKLSIQWHFCAHHYRHDLSSWKRYVSAGGGAIRFFGIHVIALLAQLGYREFVASKTFGASTDEIELWAATATGPGLPECELMIDTRSPDSTFRIACSRGGDCRPDVSGRYTDPFDSGIPAGQVSQAEIDPRAPILSAHCRTLWDATDGEIERYQRTLDLWRSAENRSSFELLGAGAPRPAFAPVTW